MTWEGGLSAIEGQPVAKVGDWDVHAERNELTRGGVAVRLEPRSMDLLVALAARAGAVASREELFAAVWPGMVVGDEALSQGITKLRRALGDDPRAPRYIETISKRGYRLTAPVHRAAPVVPGPARARAPRSKKPMVIAMAIVGVFVAAAIVTAPWPPEPAPQPAAGAADDRLIPWITVTVMPFDGGGAHGSDEAIAALGDRLDVGGRARIVAERAAQLRDALAQRLVAHHQAGPCLGEKLLAAHDLPGVRGQGREDVHGLRLDAHRLAAAAQLVGRGLRDPLADAHSS